jgi:hypothetical protein
MRDLLPFFDALWKQIPESQSDASAFLSFSQDNLPIPPSEMETDGICITSHLRLSGGYPVIAVSIEADKEYLGKLGLLIFASLFHPLPDRATLHLTHPRSTIRQLQVGLDWQKKITVPGLHESPLRYTYYPDPVELHPWLLSALQPYELPIIFLNNQKDDIISLKDFEAVDRAWGFGGVEASCRFAELLLNLSRPANHQVEVALEGEGGYRGVGIHSAAMSIWLPGGLGNLDHPVRDVGISS